MSKRTQVQSKIDEALISPDEAESLLAIAEQADKYHAIKALTDTEGGRVIREVLRDTAIHEINKLASNYKSLTHLEHISICASLNATLTHLRLLSNAKTNLEILDKEIKDTLGD
jgi:hypothetical protein